MHLRKLSFLFMILVACGDSSGPSTEVPDTRDTVETIDADDTGDAGDAGDAGDTSTDEVDTRPDTVPDVDPETSDGAFDPTKVIEVAISIPASDWDSLREQLRDPLVYIGADCLATPIPSPFTWFSATVTIGAESFADVGVRKKGNLTAYEVQRPALRLDFDRNVPTREWQGQDDLVLNRAVQDPSFVRTCLAYQLFAAAGIPAPRCGFAHVTVNGSDLGLYVHVERLDKDFLEEHFDDPSGNLYEGTLSDFRPEWHGSFELDSGSAATTDLARLTTALEALDGDLVGEVSKVLDLDAFITYWAMETLLEHVDGYTGNLNNFYVYHDPTSDRLRFLPYGADFVLVSQVEPDIYAIPAVMGTGMLARRLFAHPTTRATYLAKVQSLADTLFSDSAVTALLAEVDRMVALITPFVDDVGGFQMELEFVRAAIRGRRAAMKRGLDIAPATVVEPLRETPCLAELGSVTATFETTFGTFEQADPFAVGSGTFTLTLGDETLTFSDVGMTAGNPGPGIPVVAMQLVALTADGRRFIADIQLSPGDVMDDASLPLELSQTSVVIWEAVGGEMVPVGNVAPGTVTFSDAAPEDGATIRGGFSGTVIDPY